MQQIIDLAEQTRLLGQVAPALEDLRNDVQRTREGEIVAPVREIAPAALRAQRLAAQCIEQLRTLSTSQYAAVKDGHQNLAQLTGACAQVSLAATLCTLAINSRTEILLYEDADPTPTPAATTCDAPATKWTVRRRPTACWPGGSRGVWPPPPPEAKTSSSSATPPPQQPRPPSQPWVRPRRGGADSGPGSLAFPARSLPA